jgi:hypothetical protein
MKSKIGKSTVIVIVLIIIIITAGTAYFLFFKDKLKKVPVPESNIDKQGKKIEWTGDSFPLRKGSSGVHVEHLQAGLNILHNAGLSLDRKFGEKTLAALNKFYGVSQLSEADYNRYILPNMSKINAYMTKHVTTEKKTQDATVASAVVSFIGKSVYSVTSCKGYPGIVDDDIEYTMNEHNPINYTNGQYVGICEKDDNGWLRCSRVNGSRVFFPRKYAALK